MGNKDDKGKAPVRYFYFSGMAPIVENKSFKQELCFAYEDMLKALIDPELNALGAVGVMVNITLKSLHESFKAPVVESLKEVSYVSKLGADKYGIFNYQKGMKWSRLTDALGRHLLHFVTDDFIDEESVRDHRYHMLANLFMLAYFIEHQVGENDLEETTNEQRSIQEAEDKVQEYNS